MLFHRPCRLGVGVRPLACLLAWIPGLNSAGGVNVWLLWVLCVVRVLCVGLIIRPEQSYRMCCLSDLEASIMRRRWPTRGCCVVEKRINSNFLISPGTIQNFGLDTSNLEITRLKAYEVTVRVRNALLIDTLFAVWEVGLIRSEIKIAMSPIARVCTRNSINMCELSLVSRDKGLSPPHPKCLWRYELRYFLFWQDIVRRGSYCEEGGLQLLWIGGLQLLWRGGLQLLQTKILWL
jgi:hypothetical protein